MVVLGVREASGGAGLQVGLCGVLYWFVNSNYLVIYVSVFEDRVNLCGGEMMFTSVVELSLCLLPAEVPKELGLSHTPTFHCPGSLLHV